jgi:hypothetical protein
MKIIHLRSLLQYFPEDLRYSVSFGNSTGSGISIRVGQGIESEIAILKFIPEQNNFTFTYCYRLVNNPVTNNAETFDKLEALAKTIEEKSGLKVVLIESYTRPRA